MKEVMKEMNEEPYYWKGARVEVALVKNAWYPRPKNAGYPPRAGGGGEGKGPHPPAKPQTEAEWKARNLLLSQLSDAQQLEFEGKGWFRVKGSNGGLFRVTNAVNSYGGHTYNVIVQQPAPVSPSRSAFARCYPAGTQLCVVLTRRYGDDENPPQEDALLAQKLLLETDADRFERLAGFGAAGFGGHPRLAL